MKDTQTPITADSSPSSNESTFKTDDMNIASFIKAHGGQIVHIGLLDSEGYEKRYYFEFENAEFCSKLKLNYMNGGTVVAKDYSEAREMFVKEVKSLGKGFQ